MTAIARSRSWAPHPLRRARWTRGRAARPHAPRCRRRRPRTCRSGRCLILRAELRAHDLLRQRDGLGGHLAAQVFLRLLDLLLDDELGFLADAAARVLGERDQARLLGLRLLLDAGAIVGDLALQRREPLLLLLEPRLGRRARLGRRREVGLDLLVRACSAFFTAARRT
jgi:hypothetical protein